MSDKNKWVDSSIEEFNALVAQISKTLADERQWRDKRIAELEADLKTEIDRTNSWQEAYGKLEAECAEWRDKRIADLEAELERVNKDRQELLDLTMKQVKENTALAGELHATKSMWERDVFNFSGLNKEYLDRAITAEHENNDTGERYKELEAQCAALRTALSSAAYYYEPATTALAQSDAGSALLKRLQAAEAVCEAVEKPHRIDVAYVHARALVKAWRKAKE